MKRTRLNKIDSSSKHDSSYESDLSSEFGSGNPIRSGSAAAAVRPICRLKGGKDPSKNFEKISEKIQGNLYQDNNGDLEKISEKSHGITKYKPVTENFEDDLETKPKISKKALVRKFYKKNSEIVSKPLPVKKKLPVIPLDLIKAERCKRSLFYFIAEFWDEVAHDVFSPNWHIENVLCPELEAIARRVADNLPKEYDLVINVPPGTTKTITCSIMFPVWCWINWHWFRFITASYSGPLSLEIAEKSRDLVRSEKFTRLFPDLRIKRDKDTKSNFSIQKLVNGVWTPGGNRYSTSVDGTVTGFHGHILLVDDPLNPSQAVSELETKSASRWMDQTLSTRKVNKEVTATVLIMQRLHQADPSGHLLAKQRTNLKHICLPGEIRSPGAAELVTPPELKQYYIDDLMDVKRLSWNALEDLKMDLGQYGYAGQIIQNPVPPGGGMFKIENFQIIHTLPPPNALGTVVRYWDKAGSDGKGAYTVGIKMVQLKTGKKWIILDMKRGQWSADHRERIIKSTAEADGRDTIIYMEQEPGSGGKDSIHASITNLAGFVVQADRPTGDKIYRADPYSVQVNEGNVWLLYGDWNRDFLDEHQYFPFSTHKDIVDSAAGAFNKLRGKRQVRILR